MNSNGEHALVVFNEVAALYYNEEPKYEIGKLDFIVCYMKALEDENFEDFAFLFKLLLATARVLRWAGQLYKRLKKRSLKFQRKNTKKKCNVRQGALM